MLAAAPDAAGFRAVLPEVTAYVRGEAARIAEGRATADELVIVRKLSHRPEEYKAGGHHTVAAEALAASGHPVRVGGKIEYIVTGTRLGDPRDSLPAKPRNMTLPLTWTTQYTRSTRCCASSA